MDRMDHLGERTVGELLDQLAAAEPVPGGGSASALTGAVAAALVGMVARLTLKRKRLADVWQEMESVVSECELLRQSLLDLAQDDSDAFTGVMMAWRLEPSDARDRALQGATRSAAEVPLQVVSKSLRVLHLAAAAVDRGSPAALTDGAVAAQLARAAIAGAAMNVRINLQQLPRDGFHDRAVNSLAAAEVEADALLEPLMQRVGERLS